MCGIVGFFQKRGNEISNNHLDNMLNKIRHRGPDRTGRAKFAKVNLGIQRLSIIDLDNGNQPIFTRDKRYCIVFNGEIYNYLKLRAKLEKQTAFQTKSDTEVLLLQYVYSNKNNFLEEVNGMFAFAIWDCVEEKLVLGRDRTGEKPLFYCETEDFFFFASEIKALLEVFPSRPNQQAIWDFLTLGYVPGPHTAFDSIKQVPPAHIMIVDNSGIKIRPYWQLSLEEDKTISEQDAVIELRKRFEEAVSERIHADVPIGIFLSSGLDSNAILSVFHREYESKSRIKAYTARFAYQSYDETLAVRNVVKDFGIEHEIVDCDFNDLVENFDSMVYHCDNLMANPAMLPNFLLSRRAHKDLKVVLHGGGGDELFFGYPTYVADTLFKYLRHMFLLAEPIKLALSFFPASFEKLSMRYKSEKFLEGFGLTLERAHYHWRTIFSEKSKSDLLNSIQGEDTYHCYRDLMEENRNIDFYTRASYADFMVWWTYMGNYQADAVSMAHSLELRLPFLDHTFVEFAFRIPRSYKFNGFSKKRFFKKAIKDLVHPAILKLPKSGFHVPLAHWFYEERGRRWLMERLSKRNIEKVGLCNYDIIHKILEDHWGRKRDASFHIFNLLVLHAWYQTFIKG